MSTTPGSRQALLSELAIAVAAPSCALSSPDGDMGAAAIHGLYCDDRRLVSQLHLEVGGQPLEVASFAVTRPGQVTFTGLIRAIAPDAAPTAGIAIDTPLWASRKRTVEADGMSEQVTVHSAALAPVDVVVQLVAATDGAGMYQARVGESGTLVAPSVAAPPAPGSHSADGAPNAGDTTNVGEAPASSTPTATTYTPSADDTTGSSAPTGPGDTPSASKAPGNSHATGAPHAAAVTWQLPEGMLHLTAPQARADVDGGQARLTWHVTVPPSSSRTLTARFTWDGAPLSTHTARTAAQREQPPSAAASPAGATPPDKPAAHPAHTAPGHTGLTVATASGTFDRLLRRSIADLNALTRYDTDGTYVCAGVPWYLTLFGRDSLWTARMALPLGTDLAMGTLRALAARQGQCVDPATGEQPGKIIHELRRDQVRGALPARYYGTVDATALWMILLHEAWMWGAPPSEVAGLLPALRAALRWHLDYADGDGDGLVDYLSADVPGALANQGWKDSADAIHDRAGRLARGRVALAEVQGYAYQGALGAAALFEAASAGRLPGCPAGVLAEAPRLAAQARAYATSLQARFREMFWVRDAPVPYPATAVVHPHGFPDADTWLADSITSNMGHLPGTGSLSSQEAGWVAAHLGGAELASDFGLRTLATSSPRYHPLSYHNGSVWPHDTAIAVAGLAAQGGADAAARLARGLVAAAGVFDSRLPELWGGQCMGGPGGSALRPVPYPAACAPQAWAAASAVALVTAAVGVVPDVPRGRIALRPPARPLLGACQVTGMAVGSGTLSVEIDAGGDIAVTHAPPDIDVTVAPAE